MAKPIPSLTPNQTFLFWAKINKDGPQLPKMPDKCWVWVAGKNKWGYGRFGINGNVCFSHRIAFALSGGVFENSKPLVLHKCDNPSCCNPSHLFVGTDLDNALDREGKNRGNQAMTDKFGERNGMVKLSSNDILQIRSRYRIGGITQKELGKLYGVGRGYINSIIRLKRRIHA